MLIIKIVDAKLRNKIAQYNYYTFLHSVFVRL